MIISLIFNVVLFIGLAFLWVKRPYKDKIVEVKVPIYPTYVDCNSISELIKTVHGLKLREGHNITNAYGIKYAVVEAGVHGCAVCKTEIYDNKLYYKSSTKQYYNWKEFCEKFPQYSLKEDLYIKVHKETYLKMVEDLKEYHSALLSAGLDLPSEVEVKVNS